MNLEDRNMNVVKVVARGILFCPLVARAFIVSMIPRSRYMRSDLRVSMSRDRLDFGHF